MPWPVASDARGFQVICRIPKEQPSFRGRDGVGDAAVRQLLERLPEPVTRMLGSLAFRRTLRQGLGQTFRAPPRGHDLGHEFLQIVSIL